MSRSTTSTGALTTSRSDNTNMTRSGNGLGDGASELFQTLQGHIDDIRSLLQCGVCIRPLYEPFTLACGHTFCYSCLTSWFGGGRANRTCPDCRAPVKTQPAPAYLIRTVVQMFTSRAELLDKGETTAEHARHQHDEAEKMERDKKNTHPREGGLFRGTFNRPNQVQAPIVDVEDGVVRCPQCSWELDEIDGCGRCGYHPDDESETDASDSVMGSTDSEGNSEMTDYYDEEADDGFYHNPYWAVHPLYENLPLAVQEEIEAIRRQVHTRGDSVDTARYGWSEDGLDEEDDEDANMDSFIDDDEDDDDDVVGNNYYSESDMSTVVGGLNHTRHQHDLSNLDTDSMVSSDDYGGRHSIDPTPSESSLLHNDVEEEEDDEDEEEGGELELEEEEDEDEDDDDDDPIRMYANGARRRPGATANHIVIPSSSLSPPASTPPRANNPSSRGNQRSRHSNSGSTHLSTSRMQGRASAAGSSVYNAITLEDDSDEGPVRPSRRSRNRRGCRGIAN